MTRRPKKRKAGSCLEGPVWPGCGAGHGRRCSGISCWAVSASNEQKRRELGPWCRQGDWPWTPSQGWHHCNGAKLGCCSLPISCGNSSQRRVSAADWLRARVCGRVGHLPQRSRMPARSCRVAGVMTLLHSPANSGMNFSPRRWHHSWHSLTWSVRARSGKACYVKTTPNRMARRLAR